MLAPTDILAHQHFETLKPLCEAIGLNLAILTGSVKGNTRRQVFEDLISGKINILVGTHAIFQNNVEFKKLGLVVIDEQHRFGVDQRSELVRKGNNPDMLMMSATPIPRTLIMATRGDVELSVIRENPAGRQPIDTRVLPLKRINEVINAISRALEAGRKVYWICPLIEESEKLDLAAAEDRFLHLKNIFSNNVGIVHGRLKQSEKNIVMDDFLQDRINILIATTVIEVGVDVPKASIMVIEHADRFGLTQLHQLRGRIGRGDIASTCLLLYSPSVSDVAKQRLMIARETNDGFRLAEEDLRIRGGGDVLGTRQSGLPSFRFLNWEVHSSLIDMANNMARQILDKDPDLRMIEHRSLRTLLQIFRRDEAIKYIRS
jgi:ATP-dependent DNA helicase RecG